MKNIIINGEIYIKIKPHYIYPKEKQLEEIEEKLYNINFQEAHTGITGDSMIKKQILLELKERLSQIKIDSRYMKEFHVIEPKIHIIIMKSYNVLGQIQEIQYKEIEEINTEYIKLSTFLNEAEYIGKEFVRTKPLIINDIKDVSYITEDPYSSTTVLYKTDYAMLVEYKSTNTRYLEMLDPIYFKDNNYKFIGNKVNKDDKTETYKKVLEEIKNRNEKYKKYYKKRTN